MTRNIIWTFVLSILLGATLSAFVLLAIWKPMSYSEAMMVTGRYGLVEYDNNYYIISISKDSVPKEFYTACARLSDHYEVVVMSGNLPRYVY